MEKEKIHRMMKEKEKKEEVEVEKRKTIEKAARFLPRQLSSASNPEIERRSYQI